MAAKKRPASASTKRYDFINVPIGTIEKAEHLAGLLTAEKGVPVGRPVAVALAITEAIERRTPKGR